MNHARRIVLSAVSGLTLAATLWANPAGIPKAKPVSTNQQTPAQPQSVSGKIASVDKDSFTLNVASSQTNVSGQTASQPSTPKTMTFVIDKNTTVDGTLKVDSNAEVTYRQDNGANIAISVRVTP